MNTTQAKLARRRFSMFVYAAGLALSSTLSLLPAFSAEPALVVAPQTRPVQRVFKAPESVSDELLVSAAGNADRDDFNKALENVHGTIIKTIGEGANTLYVVRTEKGKADETLKKLSKDAHIAIAQKNFKLQLQQSVAPVNDPYFPSQWNLAALTVPQAWPTSTGRGIVIAMPDTGVTVGTPDLVGKVQAGYDAIRNVNNQTATGSHGTLMASIAAAQTNNRLNGAGVAPDAVIFPEKICDAAGFISEAALVESIYVAGNRGVRILCAGVNLPPPYSLSNVAQHRAFHTAADWYHNQKNGLLFLAAGNYHVQDTSPKSANIHVVSGINPAYTQSVVSTFGNHLFCTAPAQALIGTDAAGRVAATNGTSMGVGQVGAIAAMMLSVNPRLNNRQIETLMIRTMRRPAAPSAAWTMYFGSGLPNAQAAVLAAKDVLFLQ
jgi:thermitase